MLGWLVKAECHLVSWHSMGTKSVEFLTGSLFQNPSPLRLALESSTLLFSEILQHKKVVARVVSVCPQKFGSHHKLDGFGR